ncbi:MAG: hypothetical protein JSW28_01195, partial [Thermoplasmata archaeon]
MTVDMCPFIEEDRDSKPCPLCGIGEEAGRGEGPSRIISACLSGIKERIEEAADKPDSDKSVLLELGKLRRITTSEEEPVVDIIQKKTVLEILNLIGRIQLSMNDKDTLQMQLDFGDVLFNIGEYEKAQEMFSTLSEKNANNKKVWNN